MFARRALLIGAAAFFFAAPSIRASAEDLEIISAEETLSRVQDGSLTLVDVRTPAEWVESGVAEGAATIAMQDSELGAKLTALLNGDRTKPIALICRTGARSGAVAAAMARHGFTNVYSVGEGMFGSTHGPGWLRRGLPTVEVASQ